MNRIVTYMFWLIAILIVVAYYRGSANVLGTFGDAVNKITGTLQGRKSDGTFADYPND